jgi:hypothetical protein
MQMQTLKQKEKETESETKMPMPVPSLLVPIPMSQEGPQVAAKPEKEEVKQLKIVKSPKDGGSKEPQPREASPRARMSAEAGEGTER